MGWDMNITDIFVWKAHAALGSLSLSWTYKFSFKTDIILGTDTIPNQISFYAILKAKKCVWNCVFH